MGKAAPLFSPTVCADATPEAPAPGVGAVLPRCPKCGGQLEHESDRQGYGQTVEQCEHVARCGHWRTLEGPRIPAHTRTPRTEEPPRRGRRGRTAGAHADAADRGAAPARPSRRAAILARVAEALPAEEADALTGEQLAPRLGVTDAVAVKWLRWAYAAGRCARRKAHTGVRGNPPLAYWRRAE